MSDRKRFKPRRNADHFGGNRSKSLQFPLAVIEESSRQANEIILRGSSVEVQRRASNGWATAISDGVVLPHRVNDCATAAG